MYAEIVSPNFALRGPFEEFSFVGRLAVETKGIYHAGSLLGGISIDATYPFPTVAKSAYALYPVWAAKGGYEEVPWTNVSLQNKRLTMA